MKFKIQDEKFWNCQAQVQVQVGRRSGEGQEGQESQIWTWAIQYFWFSPIDSCSLHIDSSSTTNFRAVSSCSLNRLQLPHWFIIFTQAPLQFLTLLPLELQLYFALQLHIQLPPTALTYSSNLQLQPTALTYSSNLQLKPPAPTISSHLKLPSTLTSANSYQLQLSQNSNLQLPWSSPWGFSWILRGLDKSDGPRMGWYDLRMFRVG